MKTKILTACITGLLLLCAVFIACKKQNESADQKQPTLNATSTSDEVFTCVSQLNATEEIELYIVRHPDGSIDATRTVRPLSAGMLPRSYSLDHDIVSIGSGYGIYLDNTDYVFIPFNRTNEATDFGNEAPDGGLVEITCVCCASTSGSSMGCAPNVDDKKKFLNCYNSTGECWTEDGSVDCESKVASGGAVLPTTAWGIIMKGNSANTNMH